MQTLAPQRIKLQTSIKLLLIPTIFFCLAGLVCLVVFLLNLTQTLDFQNNALTSTGTIIKLEERPDSDGGNDYYPSVSFKTKSGQTIQFISETSYNDGKLGAKINILYLPTDPTKAKLDTFESLWLLPLIFGVFTVVLLIFGLAFLNQFLTRSWLVRHGQTIMASYTGTKEENDEGITYHYVLSEWLDPSSNKLFTFKSLRLRFKPAHLENIPIVVLIDPTNPKRYLVDSEVLKQASQNPTYAAWP